MKSIRFLSLAAKFLKWARQTLATSSVKVYYHYFRRFHNHIGNKKLSAIRPHHLSEWAKTWHEAQAIKRLFKWACKEARLIRSSPFDGVTLPPKGHRKRVMKRGEMLALIRACPADLRALLTAHRETFARPQELRDATWADVQWEDERLSRSEALRTGKAAIVLHEYKQRKKRRIPGQPRVILLSPRAGRLIDRIGRAHHDQAGHIFQTKRGKTWTRNAVRCRLRRLRKRLQLVKDRHGENIVPYTFRHSGATRAAAAGVRDRILADVLGHVEVSTTWRYQHLSIDHLRDAMQTLWNQGRRHRNRGTDLDTKGGTA